MTSSSSSSSSSTAVSAVRECHSKQITDPRQRALLVGQRRRLIERAFAQQPQIVFPTDAYSLLLLREPDVDVVAMVRHVFTDEQRASARGQRRPDEPGYVYVFRDRRDPPGVVKIGRTRRRPAQRIAEWEHELANGRRGVPHGEQQQLTLLFAQTTRLNRLAEDVVHTTLYCEWLPKRLHKGRRLIEYYRVENPLLLKALVISALAYVDEFATTLPPPPTPPQQQKAKK